MLEATEMHRRQAQINLFRATKKPTIVARETHSSTASPKKSQVLKCATPSARPDGLEVALTATRTAKRTSNLRLSSASNLKASVVVLARIQSAKTVRNGASGGTRSAQRAITPPMFSGAEEIVLMAPQT